MGRVVAVLATLACMIGLTVAPAPPAAADTPTVGGAGWSVSLTFPDLQWSSESCQYLPVTAVVAGPAVKSWTFGGFVTLHEDDGDEESNWSIDYDTKVTEGTGNFTFRHAVLLCPGYDSTGTFDVVGEVGVLLTGAVDWAWLPYRAAFSVTGIPTTTTLDSISMVGPEAMFVGRVTAAPPEPSIFRGCGGGWLTIERPAGAEWEEVGEVDVRDDGSFEARVSTYRLTGTQYRARFRGTSICGGSSSPDRVLPVRLPTVVVSVSAKQSKFKVDIDPNKGSKSWVFQVERRRDNDTWRTLKTYRTSGNRETRTINLRKGVYRIHVKARFGYAETYSDTIYLER
jgi:hypothetical protein